MSKTKKYSITVQRWDPKERRYVGILVIHSVSEAQKRYDDAVKEGDRDTITDACSILNEIREKAGLKIPVC